MMDRKNIILFYDAIAEETAREWYDKDVLLPPIQEFMRSLPPHPRVLDAGCGPGHETNRLRKLEATVIGIDISTQSLAIARKKNPDSTFIEMDFFSLDPSIGRFDGIFSAGSLIHMPYENFKIGVTNLSALLKSSGSFFVILQEGTENQIHYPEVNHTKIERIVYRFTRDAILDCFDHAGMKFVKNVELNKELIAHQWNAYLFRKNS